MQMLIACEYIPLRNYTKKRFAALFYGIEAIALAITCGMMKKMGVNTAALPA